MDGTETVLGGHERLLAQYARYADLVGYRNHAIAPEQITVGSFEIRRH